MSLLAALLKDAGHDPKHTPQHSTLGRIFLSEPVSASHELERIDSLPRRRWQDRPDLPALVDRYTARFAKKPGLRLFDMQALALAEMEQIGSVNVVASLGEGKTLVTALAPLLFDSKKPLFLNYKRLIDKTIREFRELANDWRICHDYTFLSIECLSREAYADYLDRLRADFVCIDEAHSLSNANGARFRRVRRYKDKCPQVPILPLTATPGTASIGQYAHIQDLILGAGSPLPRDEGTLLEWREALDTEVIGQRRPAGALARWSSGGDELTAVRLGVGTRIEQTPGNVYARSAESVDCSIYITDYKLDLAPNMGELVECAWREAMLPDGRCFEELYNHALILKQLGSGYAKVLDPAPPLAWREARSLWGSFVRSIIGAEDTYHLDTPAQVKGAVRSGEIDDGGLLDAWLTIEPTFKPCTKTDWFDLSVLTYAAHWLARERGLVWVTQPTVGRALAKLSGLPFFHANGVDPLLGSIEAYDGSTGAVLAVRPNMLGRNLQNRWSKNLYISPPSSATELDQSIGRTARRGQRASTVEVTFLLTVWENWASVTKARSAALAERALGKNDSSRLLLGDWCVTDLATVNTWKGPLWKR